MSDFHSLIDIQRNMASRLSQEMAMNQTVELLSLMQSLVTDKLGRVQKELVIVEASYIGIGEAECLQMIADLVRQGTLREQGEYLLF